MFPGAADLFRDEKPPPLWGAAGVNWGQKECFAALEIELALNLLILMLCRR